MHNPKLALPLEIVNALLERREDMNNCSPLEVLHGSLHEAAEAPTEEQRRMLEMPWTNRKHAVTEYIRRVLSDGAERKRVSFTRVGHIWDLRLWKLNIYGIGRKVGFSLV